MEFMSEKLEDRELRFIHDALTSKLYLDFPFPDSSPDLDWEFLYALLTHHRLAEHFYVLGKFKRDTWPVLFREKLWMNRYSLILYSNFF